MDPNSQILTRIKVMEDMGLVDEYLTHCYSLRQDDKQLFVNMIPTFTTDTSTTLEKLEAHLNHDMVDFPDLYNDCIKLLGGSGSIGAIRMRIACLYLRDALDNSRKDWCLLAWNEIKREFMALKPHLDDICQLERTSIAEENRRQGHAGF